MIRTVSKWLMRLSWLVWIIAMLLVGLKIALDNSQSVQLTLFGWQTPMFSLGLIVCVALLFGVVLGWFGSIGPYLTARRRAKRLEKQLSQSRQDVGKLRTTSRKG